MCRQTLGGHVANQATANLSSLYLALLIGRLDLRVLATNSSSFFTYANLRERARACATIESAAIVTRSGYAALMRHASSVLTGAVSVPGHMSASGSRGLIHRQSSVVAVARPTDKISCFPPPLDCVRTVSAHVDS